MPNDRFVPAEALPDVSSRATEEHRNWLVSSYPSWGSRQADALARQRASGALSAQVWRGGGAEGGRALAWIRPAPPETKVVGVWLDPGTPEVLARFLRDLEEAEGTVVSTVTDVLPGFTSGDQERFFTSRGYWRRAKVLLRRDGGSVSLSAPWPPRLRRIAPADLDAVVGVYVRAYTARPGEFWTWGAPDAWSEAEQDVKSHVEAPGTWAPGFAPEASFVWEEDGEVVGAVLVEAERQGTPYVEDLIVDPRFHRRGIGRALLARSLDELAGRGRLSVELAAIRYGAPYRLYRRLGFVEVPPPEGTLDGHWVRGASPLGALV